MIDVITSTLRNASNLLSTVISDTIVAIIILLLGFIAGKFLGRLVQKLAREFDLNTIASRLNVSYNVESFLGHAISFVIYAVAVLWGLRVIGLDTLALQIVSVFVIGLIAFSTILAIKDMIPNVISGMLIANRRMFKEGDTIESGEILGIVKKTTMLETVIETKSGDIIYVPNSLVTSRGVKRKRR